MRRCGVNLRGRWTYCKWGLCIDSRHRVKYSALLVYMAWPQAVNMGQGLRRLASTCMHIHAHVARDMCTRHIAKRRPRTFLREAAAGDYSTEFPALVVVSSGVIHVREVDLCNRLRCFFPPRLCRIFLLCSHHLDWERTFGAQDQQWLDLVVK